MSQVFRESRLGSQTSSFIDSPVPRKRSSGNSGFHSEALYLWSAGELRRRPDIMEKRGALLQHEGAATESVGKTALSAPKIVPGRKLRKWIILLAVWFLAAAYAGSYLKRGWIPHDEGVFAQSADRVMRGELPHRDYTEIYTGGLAYLHAFAFRHFGENFATLRIVLFVFFLLWVPAFYWTASRMVSDWIAGGVTLLAVVWSLPNYSAAVPSWYNLFFATFSLAALFAYLRDPSFKWLFLAGLCSGCSFLAKSTALYYVAGVLLFFLFSEQCKTLSADKLGKTRFTLYSALVVFSMLLFQAGLALLIREHGNAAEVMNFVVPPSILATLILLQEFHAGSRTSGDRIQTLFRMVLPFALGFLLPLAAFIIPFVHGNAVHAALKGIFLLPLRRLLSAYFAPPALITMVPSLYLVAILILGIRVRGAWHWIVSLATAVLIACYLIWSAHEWMFYQRMWHAAYWLTPLLTLTGALVLSSKRWKTASSSGSLERQQLYLILAVLTLCSLVQYPFSAPIYFCYVAPLVILGAVALLRQFPSIPRSLLSVVYSGFLLFGVLRVTPPFIHSMGFQYQPDPETQVMNLQRAGGLRVDHVSLEIYRKLIPMIQQHAGSGEIYAAPDCPEVYFLAGYRNPTRASFDFFQDDSRKREDVLRLLDGRPVKVIVLNRYPPFSTPLPPDLHLALQMRFPYFAIIENFEVRWRE